MITACAGDIPQKQIDRAAGLKAGSRAMKPPALGTS